MSCPRIVPDPNAVPLFEDRFENPDIGLVRVRRADLMKDTGSIRVWEWRTLEGQDGEPGTRYDRADYWAVEDLAQIVDAARNLPHPARSVA